MTPRWEFRVFGDDLAIEREALRRFSEAGDEEARTDTYFVVPGHIDASLKLRGDKLDLKILRDGWGSLELWEPAGEADFPVAPGELRERLLGPAGVRLDVPEMPVGRDLLVGMGRAAPGLRLVRLEKRRQRFRVEGVMAEFTRLSANGRPAESLALEEADPERALGALSTLGISGRRNTSYQRWLVETFLPEPEQEPGPGAGD